MTSGMGAALAAGGTPPWMTYQRPRTAPPAPAPPVPGPPPVTSTITRPRRNPMSGAKLLIIWPVILDRDYDRDELIEQAHPQVPDIAAECGVTAIGAITFRLIQDTDGIPGWEHWTGWLLTATCHAEPIPGTAGPWRNYSPEQAAA